jgi:type II secretory pathway pseudopilin PulG
VELLVVIGIVALLIALLLPALSNARSQAQFTKCAAQLREQGRAHFAYAVDYKRAKPPSWVQTPLNSVPAQWLTPNTKQRGRPFGQGILVDRKYIPFEVLLCPSEDMTEDAARDLNNWKNNSAAGSSYVYYWRQPQDPRPPFNDLPKGVTQDTARRNGNDILLMDFNAEQGHQYLGEYENRPFISHKKRKRFNVSKIDNSVQSLGIKDAVLKFPGDDTAELEWLKDANQMLK